MSVPETSVNENHDAVLGENNVWSSRQALAMQAEPKAFAMQEASHEQFWRRVLSTNGRHVATSGIRNAAASHPYLLGEDSVAPLVQAETAPDATYVE